MTFKEALYYKKLVNKKVHCNLCPHSCIIENGEIGKCEVRQNVGGNLKSMEYGKLCELKEEKIEDFMFHTIPGSKCLGIGMIGNTLSVSAKENEVENSKLKSINKTPQQIIKEAKNNGNKIIVYNYTEPIVFYEFIKDVAIKSKDLKHIIVSNGFVNEDPINEMSEYIHGAVIKIKGVDDEIYNVLYGVNAEPVLKCIKKLKENKVWVELSIKIIPGVNDSLYNIRKIASWILDNLGPDTPINIIPSKNTDIELIKKARKSAMDSGLNFVYISSNWKEGKTTFCPNCKRAVIIRDDKIENNHIEGKCKCGQEIPGIWH